jgi:hypothetical protein
MDDNYGPIFIFFSINASAFEESVWCVCSMIYFIFNA